jgi:Big-like domain-containing protein
MTQNYAYASEESTETEEQDQTDTSEEEDTFQVEEENSESESENEDEVQTLSGGSSKKDTKGPTIDNRSPNAGTATIPINMEIKVTFNEPLQISSISTATFLLKVTVDGKIIPGTASFKSRWKNGFIRCNFRSCILAILYSHTDIGCKRFGRK